VSEEAHETNILDVVEAKFRDAWPSALTAFSPYTRLFPPIYCQTVEEEKREGLTGSFAMIRMRDDRIVISIRQVVERGLADHGGAILAHEVGHYVHAPGTLIEHIRLHDRMRRSLPSGVQQFAGVVSNLYTDLLLNDRLQRSCGVDIAAVYRALKQEECGELWTLYTRMYERLWGLPTETLGPAPSAEIDGDAELGARLIRLFRDHWLDGAASFAKLVAPYFEKEDGEQAMLPGWLDMAGTDVGDQIPDGLIDDDFNADDVVHPALDDRITGDGYLEDDDEDDHKERDPNARSERGDGRPDKRKVRRTPQAYLDLLRSAGVKRDPKVVVGRYYRELAMPHVIPFPAQRIERVGDPLPEGLDVWEPSSPLDRVDWLQTMFRSPVVIPGVTTVERSFGTTEGGEPETRPPDLYIGVDCSGSMGNPAYKIAYPIIAGVVMAISALRAGAKVMACLSGEWHGKGRHLQTEGFVRNETKLLGVLTDYLGTACSFGLPRLAETFANQPPRTTPAHLLVISDSDLFGEIEGTKNGWAIAKKAIEHAGGGATAVLRLADVAHHDKWLKKMHAVGFETYKVTSEEQLVTFARAFSRRKFHFE
jgi:hypothetical protein